MTGVYAIVNIWNGNQYIGSSCKLENRRRAHFSNLRAGRHHSCHLQRAFNKYGESSFAWRVILYCETQDLLYYEQKLIDARLPVYNVLPTAGSTRGCKRGPETRRKIAEANRRRSYSKETRQKISEAASRHTGWHHSEETRRKMSEAGKGKPKSAEQVRKLSDFNRGRHSSAETCRKISEALRGNSYRKGIPHTEETRRKISEAGRGRHPSEETRHKLSESIKRAWARRKALGALRQAE